MNTKKAHETTWVPQWGFGDRLRKVRTDIGYTQVLDDDRREALAVLPQRMIPVKSGRKAA